MLDRFILCDLANQFPGHAYVSSTRLSAHVTKQLKESEQTLCLSDVFTVARHVYILPS